MLLSKLTFVHSMISYENNKTVIVKLPFPVGFKLRPLSEKQMFTYVFVMTANDERLVHGGVLTSADQRCIKQS